MKLFVQAAIVAVLALSPFTVMADNHGHSHGGESAAAEGDMSVDESADGADAHAAEGEKKAAPKKKVAKKAAKAKKAKAKKSEKM